MKPHPRIRIISLWTAAAITAAILITWLASGKFWMILGCTDHSSLSIADGHVSLMLARAPGMAEAGSFFCDRSPRYTLDLWFATSDSGVARRTSIPLWLPAAISALATALLWRHHTRTRRRASLNLCPLCDYDRSGLSPTSPCPECGNGRATP